MWFAIMAAAGLHAGAHACAPVEGSRITMRDLALVDSRFAVGDGALEIGFSPEPGSRRTFFPAELLRLAKSVDPDAPSEAPNPQVRDSAS